MATPRIYGLIASNNEAIARLKAREAVDEALVVVLAKAIDERVQLAAQTKRERRRNRNFKIKANGGIQ